MLIGLFNTFLSFFQTIQARMILGLVFMITTKWIKKVNCWVKMLKYSSNVKVHTQQQKNKTKMSWTWSAVLNYVVWPNTPWPVARAQTNWGRPALQALYLMRCDPVFVRNKDVESQSGCKQRVLRDTGAIICTQPIQIERGVSTKG